MIKNYFKTAWRILWRNKVFSAINILGLSTGLACILMFLFIQHELSYDKFNADAKNIDRITSFFSEAKDKKELAATPPPCATDEKHIHTIQSIGIGPLNPPDVWAKASASAQGDLEKPQKNCSTNI